MDAREPDITTCRRVHDVPFYGRTHTRCLSTPLPAPSVARSRASGIARLAPSHTRRRCSFFRSLGRSIVSVTRTLCEAASIKPHFYSGALHSLRPSSGSFLSPATSHFCLRRPFASFATHILWTRANAQESNGVPLHPVARIRLWTRGFDISSLIVYIYTYIINAHPARSAHEKARASDSEIFTRIAFIHAAKLSRSKWPCSRGNYGDTINEAASVPAN